MREWGKGVWAECEDVFRKKVGWRGEMALFRAALAQHQVKHPDLKSDCDVCKTIVKHISRLTIEGSAVSEAFNTGNDAYFTGERG